MSGEERPRPRKERAKETRPRAKRSRERGPGKDNKGTRRVTFNVSCQPEELAQIREKAAASGKTQSRWIVDKLLDRET